MALVSWFKYQPGRRLLHRGRLIHKMLSNEVLFIVLRRKCILIETKKWPWLTVWPPLFITDQWSDRNIHRSKNMHYTDPSNLCEQKREYGTHFEGDTPYKSQRTCNKEHSTTNKVYNSIPKSVQQLIYTRIYTCTCNWIHTYVQHKYVYRINSLTLIVISHSFRSTYRLYTSIEKVIHTDLFQWYFELFTISEQPFNLKGETAI